MALGTEMENDSSVGTDVIIGTLEWPLYVQA